MSRVRVVQKREKDRKDIRVLCISERKGKGGKVVRAIRVI